ncbi:MAG: hypothetical protein ACJAVV_001764 [Alphaproteobacteria bacterium]|jgi:hypothetical protein
MKGNYTATFIVIMLTLAAFAGGYWLGTRNTLEHLRSDKALSNNQNLSTDISKPLSNSNSQAAQSSTTFGKIIENISPHVELPNTEKSNFQLAEVQNDIELTLFENASIMDTIAFLNALNASENKDRFDKFAPALESLRNAVKNNPDNFQILIDYFAESDIDSEIPYYITSVLQSAEVEGKDILMNDLVLRLSAQGTSSGNTRLLHLISSTGMHYENEEIISTIKNIALYSQADSTNRTYALDLLMPYQLNPTEKNKVVSDLSFALNHAPREEVSYILENIIRFSNKSERINLATNYLAYTNNFETRVAILSTMHNGSIKPSDALKEKLFGIAENSSDPLSTHARDTLLYVFEIDNDEYERLRSGG